MEIFSSWLLDLFISIIICADRLMTITIQGIQNLIPCAFDNAFYPFCRNSFHKRLFVGSIFIPLTCASSSQRKMAFCQILPDIEKKRCGSLLCMIKCCFFLYPIQNGLLLHHFPLVRRPVDPSIFGCLLFQKQLVKVIFDCCLQSVILTFMAGSSMWRCWTLEISSGCMS